MKKTLVAILIIATALAACTKTSKPTGGSWTFKGVTYAPTFVNYVLGAFTAYTEQNFPSGSLAFTFCDTFSTIPRTSAITTAPHTGTYHLSNLNPPDSGYVFVRMTDTSATRNYVSIFSSTDIVTVTVNADGTSTMVDVTDIKLKSNKDTADIGSLSCHLTQINHK